jgi:hypothetical protein
LTLSVLESLARLPVSEWEAILASLSDKQVMPKAAALSTSERWSAVGTYSARIFPFRVAQLREARARGGKLSEPNAMLNFFWQKIPAFQGTTRPKPITKHDPDVFHPATTCRGRIGMLSKIAYNEQYGTSGT